jgi:hypothetical protein
MASKAQTDPPRIFISYSRQDAAIMRRLEQQLKAAGAEVWVDHAGIRSGDNLPKRISDALEWCNILLLLWSESSRKSKWVEKEWTNAEALDRLIIPCLLEKTPLPGILTNKVFIDFRGVDHGLKELLRALDLAQGSAALISAEPAQEIARVIHGGLREAAGPSEPKPPETGLADPKSRIRGQKPTVTQAPPAATKIEPKTETPTNADKLGSSGVQRTRKRVVWIAVLLVSVLSIVIYSIQTDESAEPTDASTTSSNSSLLSLDAATKMIIDRGFYDKYKNPDGKGIVHQYKLRVINGDSVVVDDATKLMWEQSGSKEYMNYADAEKYIRGLNDKAFANYKDWRLPTLEEAMLLMEPTEKNADLYIGPIFDKTQRWIWTADKRSAGVAWVVSFNNGYCRLQHPPPHQLLRPCSSLRTIWII